MKTTNARYVVEETAEDQNGSKESVRNNEAEPELITDIRNRDQGFVLFCFRFFFCLFACLFFFKSNTRNFLFC